MQLNHIELYMYIYKYTYIYHQNLCNIISKEQTKEMKANN